jgi:hypothetical protein
MRHEHLGREVRTQEAVALAQETGNHNEPTMALFFENLFAGLKPVMIILVIIRVNGRLVMNDDHVLLLTITEQAPGHYLISR